MGDTLDAAHSEQEIQMDSSVQVVRITSQGKMKAWIARSLTFLENVGEDRKIILHTLPASVDCEGRLIQPPGKQSISKNKSSTGELVPRLISVVEIIKREFMKQLDAAKSTRLLGLYQYNEIGDLEGLGIEGEGEKEADAAAQRSESIVHALTGKNYPKQRQIPFMRVTLSLKELPELVERGATYQPPSRRKVSKSAKARAKKREKKDALATVLGAVENEDSAALVAVQ